MRGARGGPRDHDTCRALRGGLCVDDIDRLLTRCGHTPGVVLARRARALRNARSRSRPESHLRVALVGSGLPEPAVNEAVHDDTGDWLFEPDLGYRDVRLAIEYKGAEHADLSRMRRDMTRTFDGYLRGGWRVIEFGPSEVFSRPDQTAAVVERLRRERS